MKITYIICWCIINLAFIAISIFLTVWFNNLNFLWFLVVPIISFIEFEIVENKKSNNPTKNEDSKSDKQ